MPQMISGLLFVGSLIFAGVNDLRSRTIPYSACILLTLAGLISFSPARLLGLALAVPFWLASRRGRGGMGDALLIAASCFLLGVLRGGAGLVLALLLPIMAGMGINFGMVLGATVFARADTTVRCDHRACSSRADRARAIRSAQDSFSFARRSDYDAARYAR